MGKRLVERQLRQVGGRLSRLRADLGVIDAQLEHLADDASDLEIRSLVSDGSAGAAEYRQARAHVDAMREHRAHVVSSIADLERRQDELLDRLGA